MDVKDFVLISIIIGLIVLCIVLHSFRNILLWNTPDKKPHALPKEEPLPDVGQDLRCSFIVNFYINFNVQQKTLIFRRGKSPVVSYEPKTSALEITTLTDNNKPRTFKVNAAIFPNHWSRLIISYTKRDVDVFVGGVFQQSHKLPNIPILHSGPITFDDTQTNLLIQYFEYANFALSIPGAYIWDRCLINRWPRFPKKSKVVASTTNDTDESTYYPKKQTILCD